MAEKTVVQVTNLVNHPVSYRLDELNVIRRFDPYESKNLPLDELRALNYKRGGRVLLKGYLSVKDKDFRKEIGIADDAIEYDYTEEDVDKILLHEPDDVLRDTLEFGPDGIKELVESRAVKLRIPDLGKREIIKEFTGVDIDKQIVLIKEQEEALAKEAEANTNATHEVEKAPTRGKRRVAIEK